MYKLDLRQGLLLAFVITVSLYVYKYVYIKDVPTLNFIVSTSSEANQSRVFSYIMDKLDQKGLKRDEFYFSFVTTSDDVRFAPRKLSKRSNIDSEITITEGPGLYKAGTEVITHHKGQHYIFINPQTKSYVLIYADGSRQQFAAEGGRIEDVYDAVANELVEIINKMKKRQLN